MDEDWFASRDHLNQQLIKVDDCTSSSPASPVPMRLGLPLRSKRRVRLAYLTQVSKTLKRIQFLERRSAHLTLETGHDV